MACARAARHPVATHSRIQHAKQWSEESQDDASDSGDDHRLMVYDRLSDLRDERAIVKNPQRILDVVGIEPLARRVRMGGGRCPANRAIILELR